jgi:hypothetical protein
MNWYQREHRRERRTAQVSDGRLFAPTEDPSKFGTPAVDISGTEPKVLEIPGVKGSVNLDMSLHSIKQALEGAFGSDFFFPITNIRIEPMSGKFGLTKSDEPHTIYINEQAMIEAVRRAVAGEAEKAKQQGIEAEFTPQIGKRINLEVAKELWETIPHERQHAIDFQDVEKHILETGEGSVQSVPEAHGEQAGKAALAKFPWYIP